MNNKTLSKLTVCHLISGDLWAGAEAMAFNLLRQLKNYPDIELFVIILNEGKLAEGLRGTGMTVHVIDENQCSFWQIVRRTRAILQISPPDLIHSHRYKENLLATISTGVKGSSKLIATQHGLPESAHKGTTFISNCKSKLNFHLLSHYFTKTVAVSMDIRNSLVQQHAFHQHHIETIHNGIELPGAVESKPTDASFVIGSSGRLSPVKDYPLMIEIARALNTNNVQDLHFELAGEGPVRPVLESMLERYNLRDSFTMQGHQDNMDRFYRGIDLYLNTSVHEGIPMTILEALARGIPVVAPAVGGINEIITDGVEGFLIKDRSPEAFAEKCLLLRDDRQLHANMSKAAQDRAKRSFSAENMAEKYYRLYRRSAAQPRQQYCNLADAFNLARERHL